MTEPTFSVAATPRQTAETPEEIAAWLVATAAGLGLPHLAFTPADELDQHSRYLAWTAADYAGELVYLVGADQGNARRDPRSLRARKPRQRSGSGRAWSEMYLNDGE